jgi:carbon monoxide dehydrogenase subunit G
MATLYKQLVIAAPRDLVWDAVRDVGALHSRLVPGFVRDTRMDGDARIVTFSNGMVVREPIISIDDQRFRLAWGAEGARTTHYNAVLQVFSDPAGSRVEWTTDLLPDDLVPAISAMQDQALAAMKPALETAVRGSAGVAASSASPDR